MYKKKYDKEAADKKLRRTVIRNWIIMFISLGLIVVCYYFVR